MKIFGVDDKKRRKRKKRKGGKVRTSQKIIIGVFLLFVFFLVFLYFHSQKVTEETLSEEQVFQKEKREELDTAKERISQDNYEPSSSRLIRTFGDSFTSLSAINRDLTDMYWDSQVSAFLFPPEISMKKIKDCSQSACGYHIQDEDWQEFCNHQSCIERRGKDLFLDGKDLQLPEEINQDRLISISLGGVGDGWYFGFIFGDNNQDQNAWIYRFDGQDFYPLINNQTELDFNIRESTSNGYLSFGGKRDDLYIVYGGYFGQIKRLKHEKQLIDLSEFFSLRFTSNGFFPKIQTSPKSQSTYICNTRNNRVNILKLWQDREGQEIGAVDLRTLAISDLGPQRIDCLPGDENFDLKILVNTRAGWQKWGLIDDGFDNKIIRQVVSKDINATNREVRAAIVNSYLINSEKPWDDTFQLFFSSEKEDFTPVLPGNWYEINSPGKNLYWRVIFKNDMDNPYYSPWLDNFSVINYEIAEEDKESN